MPSYQRTGKKTCPRCKSICTTVICPSCSVKTQAEGKWSVRFYVAERGVMSLKRLSGYEKKKEAEAAYREFMSNYKAEEAPAEMTFGQLFILYQRHAAMNLKTASYVSNVSKITNHVLPAFADTPLSELTPQLILAWKSKLKAEGHAHAYLTNIYYGLSAVLRFGRDIYDLDCNPLAKVGNFVNHELPKEMKYWTEDEFKQFIAVVDNKEYKTLFALLFLSGCRRGEALALTWADYKDKRLNITKSVTYKAKNGLGYEITTPKNKTSVRIVEIPDTLCAMLDALKNSSPDSAYIFGGKHPLSQSVLHRAFINHIKAAKVKQIRIHDLRHSHATLLFSKGMDILQIARRLGHSDVAQLLNRYAHLRPDRQAQLIQAINLEI